MRTVVVMPTYNERDNIGPMLDALLEQRGLQVLIVDDNSPDGTAEVVRERMKKTSRLHLLGGEKKGLGVAYKRGMEHALSELGAEVVMEMDADFSHDPKDIPRLLEALNDADVVIGSRYVKGGGTPGWPRHRRLISWGGNVLARTLSGLWRVKDTTAGFRAIRASALEGVDWDAIPANGYGFQIALLHLLKERGARIEEAPVTFRDRESGETKMSLPDLSEFFFLAFKLGWWTYGQLIRFLLVGASGLVINYGMFAVLGLSGLAAYWLAIAAATEVSILWNFVLHEHWTFRRKSGHWAERMAKYHATSLGGIIVTYASFYALLLWIEASVAYLAAIVLATAWNYLLSSRWAFRR